MGMLCRSRQAARYEQLTDTLLSGVDASKLYAILEAYENGDGSLEYALSALDDKEQEALRRFNRRILFADGAELDDMLSIVEGAGDLPTLYDNAEPARERLNYLLGDILDDLP